MTKFTRYYFYNTGIRNAVLDNFNHPDTRNDIGGLWKNYLFLERMKKRDYQNIYANQYFWRTHDQKEIDLIEEREGKLYGYEFKWGKSKKTKAPKIWLDTYTNAEYEIINKENFFNFIT